MLFFGFFSLFAVTYGNHINYESNIYNESISRIAVNLSQASYCDVSTWSCPTCDKTNILETIIESHGNRILLGYNTELTALFVSFRGSSNIQNWIDDIQIRKIYPYDDANIAVEKGFYTGYESTKSDVFDTLEMLNIKYSTKTILITGHSYGAALATLTAFDILNMYDVQLYTYGSPRVGNEYFVNHFNTSSNMYRITHYYDIVPHVPPKSFDFLHVPQEIWYNEENTQYTICSDHYDQEDDLCSDSCGPTHCTSTSDHLNYLGIPMGSSNGLC
jgi:predicted lipase